MTSDTRRKLNRQAAELAVHKRFGSDADWNKQFTSDDLKDGSALHTITKAREDAYTRGYIDGLEAAANTLEAENELFDPDDFMQQLYPLGIIMSADTLECPTCGKLAETSKLHRKCLTERCGGTIPDDIEQLIRIFKLEEGKDNEP